MRLLEKTVYTATAIVALTIAGYFVAWWWTTTIPNRPKGVAPNAVFLWAPNVGLPAPRRGRWLSCQQSTTANQCELSGINGKTEYEGEFVPYRRKGSLSADQLKIDTEKTGDDNVWTGNALVPIVYLENGEILIPASKYEEGAQLIEQRKIRR